MKRLEFDRKSKKWLTIISVVLVIFTLGMSLLYNYGLTHIPFFPELPSHKQVKIACVGDSVTYGYGIDDWEEKNYPVVLQNLLGDSYHVMNFGVSGYCVQNDSDKPYTSSENYELSLNYDADIVIFMLGSNDSKIQNWQGIEHFEDAYLNLLEDYKNSNVILCTPATAFYIDDEGNVAREEEDRITTFNIQPEVIEEIANIVRSIASEYGYPLIDINNLTENHPEWFTLDGTHPSDEGAKAIAEAVYNKVKELK